MDKYDRQSQTKEKIILDLGCGTNPHKNATHILDIDKSIAREFPDKKFIHHDLNNLPLPFKDSSVDKIYLAHILEHLDVPDDLIFRELKRVLKVHGYLKIEVPNSIFIYHRLLYLVGIIPCDFILTHKKHYTFQHLKLNLRNAGFKIFEPSNLPIFIPFRNFIYSHIKLKVKKVG